MPEPEEAKIQACGMTLWRDSILKWDFRPESSSRAAQVVIWNNHGSPSQYVTEFPDTDTARAEVRRIDQQMGHRRFGGDYERVYGA